MKTGRAIRLAAAVTMVASVVTFAPATGDAADIPDSSTLTTIDAGAYIIDMGVTPQTYENGLLPYGLIYELMIVNQIPVEWVIDDAKVKDGVDFTFNGKDYKGGAFIVLAAYADAAAPVIAAWQANGVVVDGPTATSFQAPIFDTLTNWPNAILDAKNGGIAQGYYEEAGIPQVVTAANGTTKTAYQFKDPALLDACDDIYVMPHADPEWESHQNLVPFNDQGGYIWAACHAVSVLENVADPGDGDPDPEMNFLSTEGLIDFGDHGGGSPPYSYRTDLGSDPIMQFIGVPDEAQQNGSEQIYMPSPGSAWRPSSTVLGWDPDQEDLISEGGESPGEATALVYGRGFGDDTNGYVMYEGGHSHDKGSADAVAAIRAFFNLHLMAGIERGMDVEVTLPEPIVGGSTVDVSATVSGGTPDYTYEWTSSCGGTFATQSGTSATGDVVTQFTAPTNAQDCIIRLVVDDTCGRTSFAAGATEIVEIADLAIDKTDGLTSIETGLAHSYTLTVDNLGPGVATNVTVTDPLPAQLTYKIATPSQGTCFFDGTSVVCNLGEIAINGSATITIDSTVKDDAAGTITNTATVTASQLDPDPSNDSSTDTTEVGPNGLRLDKSADPDFIDEANIPADVTFTFIVTNEGPNELTNVAISDPDVAGCTPTFVGGDTDGDSALDPGEAWEFNCTVPISADTDNTATASADDPVIGPVTATDTAHVEAIAPGFSITKGPDGAQHSDDADVVFEVVVTNTGDVDLFDITVTDAAAPSCDRFIGSLPVGVSMSYYCSISPAPAAGTSDVNTVDATAYDPGGSPLTATDDAPYEVVDRDLGITKTPIECTSGTPLVDPAFYPGDSVCYEVVVTNTGTATQNSVTLSDALPAGLALVSADIVAPRELISDDFNRDLKGDDFYGTDLSEYNDDDKAGGGDVVLSDKGAPDCPSGNCLIIKKEDVAIQWQTDLSGVTTVDIAFDWLIQKNDNVDGFFDAACWDGAAWQSLAQLTIEDDTTVPNTPGPVNSESFTALTLPAGCQIAGGALGLVMDPASTNHEIAVDNLSFTAGSDSLFDDFEYFKSKAYLEGWAEFNDNDPADAEGGDVRSRNSSNFNDCDIPGDCAVGIEKGDVGIIWPTDYSSLGQCSITFDWAVFDTENDPGGRISVGGTNAGGGWVEVAEIDISGVAAPSAFTTFSTTFDDATFPGIFHAAGGVGVKSGIDNDKEQILIDNIAISCLSSFTRDSSFDPDLITAADDVDLPPGGTMTATITATVEAPGETFPRELANLAQTTSVEQPTPSEAVATVDRVVPLIELQKDAAPALIAAGDLVTYTFSVSNPGNEPLENVSVTDTGVAGCTPTLVSGDDNGDSILDVTEAWVYECTVAPPSAVSPFVNTATAEGDPVTPGTGEADPVSDTDDATVEIVVSGIDVVKSVDRSIIRPNETVTYTYEVSLAAGTVEELSGVFVTDDVCSPVVGPNSGDDGDGVLQDGETWVYTCAAILATTTTNTATAQGTDRADIDVTGTDTATVTVIEPSFDVVKTATPDTIAIGDSVTYTVDVINTGNDPLSNVTVADDTCSPLTGPTGDDGNGTLDIGETWTYTCSTSTLTDDTTNVADVTAVDSLGKTWDEFDDAFVNVLTPSIDVGKVNDGALVFPDGLVTYTITVFNDGDSDFDSVTIADDTCSPLTGPTESGVVDGVLSVGESWLYDCMTTLPVTTTNTVTVDADGPGGAATATDSSEVRVHEPLLDITKTPSATVVDPGTLVTYDFTVTNVSVCAAGDTICELDHELQTVVVTDDHCATVDPVDSTGDGFNDGDTGDNGPDGIMSIGETWLFTCSASVDAPTTNTASPTSTDVLGDIVPLSPPTATAFVDVTADPELTVVKTGPDSAGVGEVVTYTIDVANSTDCTIHADPTWCADNSWVDNVAVDDDVAGPTSPVESGGFNVGDTNANGLLDVGETWQFTVDYTVTQADLAASPLVNTATATGTDKDGDTESASGTHSLDVVAMPALEVVKTAGGAADGDVLYVANPPQTVTYTYTITNTGDTYLSDITVDDDQAATNPVCTFAGPVAPGGNETCTFDLDVSVDTTNVATVTGNPTDDQGNDLPGVTDPTATDDAEVVVVAPAVEVIKTAGSAADGGVYFIPAPADVIYNYVVTNTGDTDLVDITVDDSELGLVCTIAGPLVPGDSESCTQTANIAVDTTNVVTATGTPVDGNQLPLPDVDPATDIDDAVVQIVPLDPLGDFVWLDLDEDGIQDAGEPGVEGVTVNLYDDGGVLVATTVTDANGAYGFDIDPDAAYEVEVVSPAATFSPQDFGDDDTIDSDADAAGIVVVEPLNACLINYGALTLNAADPPVVFPSFTFGDPVVGGGQRFGGGGAVEMFDASFFNGQNPSDPRLAWEGNVRVTFEHLTPANALSGAFHSWFSAPEAQVRVTSYDDFNWDTVVSENGTQYKVNGRGIFSGGPVNEYRYTFDFSTLDVGYLPAGTFVAFTDVDGLGAGETINASATGLTTAGAPWLGYTTRKVVGGPQSLFTYVPADNTYNFDTAVPSTNGAVVYQTTQNLSSIVYDVSQPGGASVGFKLFAPLVCPLPGDIADAGILPATFTSKIWLDLNGDGVLDPGEDGIEGVTVEITDANGNVYTTTTDANGDYLFENLPPGDFDVQVTYPGATYSPPGADSDVDATGAVTVTLNSGANSGTGDAGVLVASLSDVVWVDLNADGLQDPGEPGVEGVTVNLYDDAGTLVASTTTAADGTYTFDDLAPGDYSVEVVAPTGAIFTAQNVGGDETIDSDVDPTDGTVDVTLASGPTVDASAAGFLPASISGVLWFDNDADGAIGPAEGFIPGVDVNLYDDQGTLVATVTTGPDGSYTFPGLAPGDYTVEVDETTLPPDLVQTFDLDGLLDGQTVVTVGLSETVEDVNFGYQEPATVTGVIFDDLNADGIQDPGEPGLPNVDVTITDSEGNVVVVTTGPDGSYTAAVRPGDVTIDVVDATVPNGYFLTTGNDPHTITAPAGESTSAEPIGYHLAAPMLTVVKDGPATANVGDTVTYTFTVEHDLVNGDGTDISNVVIADDVAGTPVLVSGDDGDGILQSTETWVYEATYTVLATDPDPLTNTVTVDAESTGGDPLPQATDTHEVDVTFGPAFTVVKDGPATANVGDTVTYTFTVEHDLVTGDGSDISNVVVADDVAGTPTLVSGDDGDGILQSTEAWVYEATYTVLVTDPDPLTNTVTVDGTDRDDEAVPQATDTHEVDITFGPAWTVVKDGPATASVGETVTYSFTVEHDLVTGDGSDISNVVIADDVAGTPTLVSGDDGDGILQSTETWVYEATYTVLVTDPDPLTNTVTVDGTDRDDDAVPQATDTHEVDITFGPAWTVVKDGPATASVGETVTYSFTVEHDLVAGDGSDISNVVIADDVAGTPTLVSGDDGDGILQSTETWVYEATYTVLVTDPDPLTNTVTVDGTDRDDDAVPQATDTHEVDITFGPAWTVVKDGPATASVGETVTYSFTVEHDLVTGDGSDISNVVIADDVAGTPTLVSGDDGDGILQSTETWVYEATYTVLVTDPDPLTNTVTVDGTDRDDDAVPQATDTHEVDITFGPAWTVVKDGPATASVGETITFTFTVEHDLVNGDGSDISSVVIADDVAGTPNLISGDDGDGLLEAGEVWVYEATHTIIATDPDPLTNTVTVDGTDRDDEAVPQATDTHEVDITFGPAFTVVKDGPATALVGDTVTYTFTVEHDLVTGDGSDISNVVVADDVAGTPVLVSGDDGDGILQSTETWVYEATYTVLSSDPDPLTNTVTVDGTDRDGEPVPQGTDSHDTVLDFTAVLTVVKDGPATAVVGETITYTFTVEHDLVAGDGSDISNVVISDDVAGTPTLISGDDGDGILQSTETWVYEATYTVLSSDPDPLTNTVTVDGTDRDGEPVPQATDTHDTDLGNAPVLIVVKDGPAAATVGELVTYTFTVEHDLVNGDGTDVSNVVILDDVAATPMLISGDDGDGILQSGEVWVYEATHTITATDPDPLTNTVTVDGTDRDGNAIPQATDIHDVDIDFSPAWTVVKDGPASAAVGETVTYTFTVEHDLVSGDGSDIANVSVVDDVAGAATLVSGDDGDGILQSGETWVYEATYTVLATDTDPLTNTVTVTGDDRDGEPVPEVTDTHDLDIEFGPAFDVVKDGPATAVVGESITFTFTVTNDDIVGDGSDISNVVISDDVAGTPTLVSGDDGDGILQLGEVWVYEATYTVLSTDPDPLTNTVTVDGTDRDGDPAPSETDSHDTDIEFDPAWTVVKDGPATAVVGETITYTFTVEHDVVAGDGSDISDVVISDDVAGTPTLVSGDDGDGILESGEVWVYEATHTIDATDPDPLTNTVTVDGTDRDGDPVPQATDTHDTDLEFAPVLTVVKDGSTTAVVGATVTYTFTVEHDLTAGDGSDVSNVVIVDDVAGTPTLVSGDDGDGILQAGEVWVYEATHTIVVTDPDPLVNTVTVDGTDRDGEPIPQATDSHEVDIEFGPAFDVVKDGPATAVVGESITFTFTVTNDDIVGDGSDISNVVISDDVAGTPTLVSGDDGDGILQLGEVWVYEATYTVLSTDPDPLTNTVTVDGTDRDGDPAPSETDSHDTDIEFDPAWTVVKDGPATAVVGETITYTFTVEHDVVAGDGSDISDVVISDDVAGTPTLVSGDDGDGILESGEVWVYEATHTIDATDPDPLTNTVTVDGTDRDGDPVPQATDTHDTDLEFAPVLTVVKDGSTTAVVGATVTYTFTVEHDLTAGDGSDVSNVVIVDDVAGTPTLVSGDDGDGILQAGEVWVYEATHTIVVTDPDPLVNTVTVDGTDRDGEPIPQATDSHEVDIEFGPAFDVVKDGPATAVVGESITFTFTVTNDDIVGDGSDISNVVISDDVAGTPTLVSGDDGDGILQLGEVWVYEATYTVLSTDPDPLTNTVTVDGTDRDGDPAPSETDSHDTDIEFAPALAIVKSGPATATVGETVTYTFDVTNDDVAGDGSDISNVVVEDDVAGSATLVSGDDNNDGILQLGETWVFEATYTVLATDPDPLTNTVTASGDDRDSEPVPDATDTHDTDIEFAPAWTVVKDGPVTATVGETVTYTFTVEHDLVNGDGSDISDVVISDDVAGTPTLVSGDDGDGILEAGEVWLYEATYTPLATDDDPLTNTVTVDGTDRDGDPAPTETDTHDTDIDFAPAMTVVKDGPATAVVGETVTYTFTVEHDLVSGDGSDISNVTVDDDVAGAATLVSGDDGDGILQAGEVWTYEATYTILATDDDPLTNIATTTGEDRDAEAVPEATDSHQLDIDFAPAMVVVKSGPAEARVEETITYTFVVSHDLVNGDGSDISGVAISDDVAGTPTLVSGDANNDGILQSTEAWTYEATYTVAVDDPDPVTNTVTVDGEDRDGEPTPQATDTHDTSVIPLADLSITKTSAPNPYVPGEQLTYTIVVTNDGPSAAEAVVVSDELPTGVEFVSATPDAGTCENTEGTVTCDLGSLAAGAVVTITIVVDVAADAPNEVSNTASVSTDTEDPDPSNNEDTDSNLADPMADLVLDKSVSTDSALVGDELVYTLTVTNLGPSAAGDVVVNEVLPASLTFVAAEASVGSYDDAAGTWDIGTMAVDETVTLDVTAVVAEAGTITNSADVRSSVADPNMGNNVSAAQVEVLVLANITGRVWYDTNANGTIDTGEVDISDVRLTLVWAGPDGIIDTADDEYGGEAFTSSPYWFRDLAAGTYQVSVDQSTLPEGVEPTFDIDRNLDSVAVVTVDAGETRFDVDFGYVAQGTLPRTGSDLDVAALAGGVMLLLGSALVVFVAGRRRRRRRAA